MPRRYLSYHIAAGPGPSPEGGVAFDERHIAVRFQYEWHNAMGQWFRSYGNELWEFDDDGLMRRREASINDVPITESERKFFWPAPGPRPADHPGIPDVK
jgi:nuclear transport factor 2 (NTF2) superfamily protein